LAGTYAVGADIVIIFGFDSNLEVSHVWGDVNLERSGSPSGEFEFFEAFFPIFTGLCPEFAFQIDRRVGEFQNVSPGLIRYEHDPVFVAVGVYRVELRLIGEYL
jgi:hypothetical protein